MPLAGEKMMIAAMIDPIEQGQTFSKIPAHMTIIRWFNLQESRRARLEFAIDNVFLNSDLYQDTVGAGRELFGIEHNEPVRKMIIRGSNDRAPYYGLHSLVEGLGSFDLDDPYRDVFNPHVTDTDQVRIQRGEKVAFAAIALIGTMTDDVTRKKYVMKHYPLGDQDG